jgi:penicillin-binding protein 1A
MNIFEKNYLVYTYIQKYFKEISRRTWIIFAGCILVMAGTIALVNLSGIPKFSQLEQPDMEQASVIYDINGEQFGRYYIKNRVPVEYKDLSPHVINAVIAIEDARFHEHSGIDLVALFRVGVKSMLLMQESSGGGSTISQQLAKLLFKRPDLTSYPKFIRVFFLIPIKIKEWIVASKLERFYTKEEILTMYLNQFEFINGAHGIQSAANIYFNKDQSKLTAGEAAVLAGMLKNPSLFNPVRFKEKSTLRRNTVLDVMHSKGFISREELKAFKTSPIDLSSFKKDDHSEGFAPYFRAELTKSLKSLLQEQNLVKEDGSSYDIYRDGLRIYTTIDLTYQNYAEAAVFEHMKALQKKFFRVWKGMDPWKYDADINQQKIRYTILERQCRQSDRYVALSNKLLDPIRIKVSSVIEDEVELSDNYLELLFEKKIFEKIPFFEPDGTIPSSLVQKIKAIKLSNQYAILKNDFEAAARKINAEFTTSVPMKIYDYETGGEKTENMSPLDSVRFHQMHLQTGLFAVEPSTGHVKAWVGGIGHKYFKYDHVTMRRAVGSTIKPFVYTQAIAISSISPCQEFEDIQYTIAPGDAQFDVLEEWSPANSTESFSGGKYNLFDGLMWSKNSITVRLLKELGSVQPVRDLMRNMGIQVDKKLSNGSLAVPNLPSVCLGAVDLTLLEMTGAYTTFANSGNFTKPVLISRIEDKNGKVLYEEFPKNKAAVNPLTNAVMVNMLQKSARADVKSAFGGKTGTTNDYSDGWFMAITPTLVVGVWTGGDDKWMRFLNLNDGQGATLAKPMAVKLIQKLEADKNSGYNMDATFPNPPTGYKDLVDCELFKTMNNPSQQDDSEKVNEFDNEFDQDF